MIVHTETNFVDLIDVEIGSDLIIQNLLNRNKLMPSKALRAPLVIMIGCETTRLATFGFDLSNQLMNHGAAIVLSNFTKIRGRQAAPVVMKLVEFLKVQTGKEQIFGNVMLRLKQYLLSKGIMVALSLTALGDADYKVKS